MRPATHSVVICAQIKDVSLGIGQGGDGAVILHSIWSHAGCPEIDEPLNFVGKHFNIARQVEMHPRFGVSLPGGC